MQQANEENMSLVGWAAWHTQQAISTSGAPNAQIRLLGLCCKEPCNSVHDATSLHQREPTHRAAGWAVALILPDTTECPAQKGSQQQRLPEWHLSPIECLRLT